MVAALAIVAIQLFRPASTPTARLAPPVNVGVDRWTTGDKMAIGTAATRQSNVWFTAVHGTLADVMYPTVDVDNLRQFGYLVTDGSTFFFDAATDGVATSKVTDDRALTYELRVDDPLHGFSLVTEIASDATSPVVLVRTHLVANPKKLHVYAYLVPHLGGSGAAQTAFFEGTRGYVSKGSTWLAVGDDAAMGARTAGFLAHGDGYDQLHQDWITKVHDQAGPGRVTVTWELPSSGPWTTALALGHSKHDVAAELDATMKKGAQAIFDDYRAGWRAYASRIAAPQGAQPLFFYSVEVIKMAEDKLHPGAIVASLARPWGDTAPDNDGDVGYRKVWPRDLYHAASALLAAGDTATAYDVLRFMGKQQKPDGSMPQNTDLEGKPVWTGQQLDETADAILLAVRVGARASGPDIAKAADYIVTNGPATQQERWEEASGYSPATIGAEIAALRAAARWAGQIHEFPDRASSWQRAADAWDHALDAWTFTSTGPLTALAGGGYYLRISPDGKPDSAEPIDIANGGGVWDQREIVDPSFLELVRLDVRNPNDPRIVQTMKAVDAAARYAQGGIAMYFRYPHDGYGEKNAGSAPPGKGHVWPLLTGEHGVFEVMAGGADAPGFQIDLEHLAGPEQLLGEQVWEGSDEATGSARPLVWAHAEYIILAKAVATGVVDDMPA